MMYSLCYSCETCSPQLSNDTRIQKNVCHIYCFLSQLRRALTGRYFKVGIKERSPIFRSQDSQDEEYRVSQIFFVWFDHLSDLWFVSSLPVVDCTKGSPEWESAGIIACMDSSMKDMWCPWNAAHTCNLEVSLGLDYETRVKMHNVELLRKWQDWWHNGGQNLLLQEPPVCPPPPPNPPPPKDPQGVKRKEPTPPTEPPPASMLFGTHLPQPPPAPKAASSSTSPKVVPPTPPQVPVHSEAKGQGKESEKPYFSWKARCVALVATMDMNLPMKMQYLITKLLGYYSVSLESYVAAVRMFCDICDSTCATQTCI